MRIPKLWLEPIQGYDPWRNSKAFTFDIKTANACCDFFPRYLTHGKGEWAGKPFELERWQKKYIGHLFGWKRSDGTRRYRKSFLYVPKKNGKTQLAAGVGIILMVADDEPGAEVYSASGDKDQAALIFEAGSYMVENKQELNELIRILPGYKLMKFDTTGSYWKVLSSEAKTKHGPNIHGLILDELHVFPNDELIDTLENGTAARTQPLTLALTTADYDRVSPCNDELEYAIKVRDGIIDDPYYLPALWITDPEADWTSEKTWKAANPNYDITVKKSYFEEKVKKAQEQPSKENSFKRLHLNIQTKQEHKWMDLQKWDASGQTLDPSELLGKPCFAGLDLSNTRDITAKALFFPDYCALLLKFWVPEFTAKQKLEYQIWHDQGYVNLCDGPVVDYEQVRTDLLDDSERYQVLGVGFDPYNAAQLSVKLADTDGLPMISFRQGFLSMSEPIKQMERLILTRSLVHFANPVLRWMISNADIKEDPAGNVKIVKPGKDSPKKVDGVVASVMAIGLSIAHKVEEESIFDSDPDAFAAAIKKIYNES